MGRRAGSSGWRRVGSSAVAAGGDARVRRHTPATATAAAGIELAPMMWMIVTEEDLCTRSIGSLLPTGR